MNNEVVRIASMPDSVRVSDVGIVFTSDIAFEDWSRLMSTLSRLETAFQFALGDALNYGSSAYGEKYSQAMESTGHSYQGLANFAWVSRSVPHENRKAGLSWSHHRAVARLDLEEQKAVLDDATARGLTHDQLVAAVKGTPTDSRIVELVKVPEGMTPHEAERLLKNAHQCSGDVTLCQECPFR